MYRGDVLYEQSRFNEKIPEGDEQRLPVVMESRTGSTIQGDVNMKGKLESVPSVGIRTFVFIDRVLLSIRQYPRKEIISNLLKNENMKSNLVKNRISKMRIICMILIIAIHIVVLFRNVLKWRMTFCVMIVYMFQVSLLFAFGSIYRIDTLFGLYRREMQLSKM